MRERLLNEAGVTEEALETLAKSLNWAKSALQEIEQRLLSAREIAPVTSRERSLMNQNLLLLVDQSEAAIERMLQNFQKRTLERDNLIMLLPFREANEHAQAISIFVSRCQELISSIERYVDMQRTLDMVFAP